MSNIFPFFSNIRWQDVVDILINSYILFRIYVIFRGTNVFRVLFGVAFLWFFQRFAVSMGLIVSSWVLQGITAVAAFIIIVVFRNEIRSFLQAKNLRTLLWGVPRKVAETPIEIIADSVFELAQSHIGGLMVLPGRDAIEEVTQRGIRWGGFFSREMLKSIFWHDNPVHDGAAIIEGDKVVEVGVILPLSHRKDLPSGYGTRHRAAAGLAEKTDALVIVASEEKGTVIIAKGTYLNIIKRKEELVQLLRDHVGIHSGERNHPKRQFELGIAALASILIIGGVWFSFTTGLDTLITLEVPVEYINNDPGKEIVDTSVNAVRLYLSGSSVLLKSIRPEQVKVRIDIEKAVVGNNNIAIKNENISLPPRVFLKKVKPLVIEVVVDSIIKRDLYVQVDWVGDLPKDKILTSVKLNPERIQVMGGSRILKDISTIYTEKIYVDTIKKTGKITVKPEINRPSLVIAPSSKDRITVEYVVKERIH